MGVWLVSRSTRAGEAAGCLLLMALPVLVGGAVLGWWISGPLGSALVVGMLLVIAVGYDPGPGI